MGALKLGLFGFHRGADLRPDLLARRARVAEQVGFESLWVGDHIVLPAGPGDETPGHVGDSRLEALITLAFLAAQTTTVLLGTAVIVVPQRQPLLLARQLASLDVLSGGRLIFGVGVGWLEGELRALGVAMSERGARTDDYLAAMRAIWTGDTASHGGRYASFSNLVARPGPVQRPHPPIVVGGNSPGAFRRAIQQANGWTGWNLGLEATAERLGRLRDAARRYARPVELGQLEITVGVPSPVGPETAGRYAALGVHRLVLLPGDEAGAMDRVIEAAGRELIGRV
ncbi:MAG: TIGR03619 family F420-dependent LLM class oxidoreductase [Chloroflexota bacterium]|nr:TIGR03619 family F420-dependent LLM class oxidoreductase [Chloroflexota bacterium]